MQKHNSRNRPRGRPAPRKHYLALYFKPFFDTQSYPWYGIGHQEGHPVSRPRHSYVSGPLKVLSAAKLRMAAYFNPCQA